MDPATLRGELERRGLVLLGVGEHNANREVFVVYLHGLAGQWVRGEPVLEVIESVPGVVNAVESVQTPAIVLVRVVPDAPPLAGSRGSS